MAQLLANAVVLGCSYALMAVGLNMIYGLLRIIHVAHAGVYALGAYVGLFALSLSGSLWSALILGMLASGIAGMLIYRSVYHPVLDKPRYIPLIASAGLFVASQEFFRLIAGPYPHAFPAQFQFASVSTPAFKLTEAQMLIVVFTLLSFLALYILISKTYVGLAWRACVQDMDMAAALGINIDHVIALNFFLGSALAGAAGILMAVYRNSVFPTMGAMVSYKAFVVVVLGGLGSMPGAVIAGLLLAVIESLLGAATFFEFPRDAIAFLVMVLVLMFKPKGILGK